MRPAILLLGLVLASGVRAETQVVWEETPTHRVKVKYVDGEEVGRWRFRKKPPPPEPTEPAAQKVLPASAALPSVDPLADRELLELRLAELRARRMGERLEDPAAWARTGREIWTLAHASMEAAFRRGGASPEAEAFTALAAETFDPGDASVAFEPALLPLARSVIQRVRELHELIPRDAGRAVRSRVFEGLLHVSGIRRAMRRPAEALAVAEEASRFLDGADYPGIQLDRARARKAEALALLAREERTHASGFVEKVYVRIPGQESCGQAAETLKQAQDDLVEGLEAVKAMAESGEVPGAALPSLDDFREQVEAVRGLTKAAGLCRSAPVPPLGSSRRAPPIRKESENPDP